MKSISTLFLSFLTVLSGLIPVAHACSVCGCSLSSDWAAQGYATQAGLEAGLRFEYFEQSELRSGSGGVDRSTLTFPNDSEIQQKTVNRNTWLDLNYMAGSSWAFSASIPYHDRFHTTIAEGDTGISTSRASGLGDVRLLARYQQTSSAHSFSLQFGLKLPTGRFDQNFAEGPQAGALLDRGLQLGTGTTDLLLGATWFARPATAWGAFGSVQLAQPLAARDGFIPSTSLTLSGGLRWLNSSRITPQLQLNLKTETREHGAGADTRNSGGTVAYLSPGLTVELTPHASAFAFVQIPVWQHWNGLQLQPHSLLITGVRCRW